jgi:hypothetical protein
MVPTMRPCVLALVAFLAGAAGGVVSSRAIGEARAQVGDLVVVPVPAQGVVFRGSGGNAIARIRGDVTGGMVEVLDAREQMAVRLRATASGGVIELGPRSATTLAVVGAASDPGY